MPSWINPHFFLYASVLFNVGSTLLYLWAGEYNRAWYFASAFSINLCLLVGLK